MTTTEESTSVESTSAVTTPSSSTATETLTQTSEATTLDQDSLQDNNGLLELETIYQDLQKHFVFLFKTETFIISFREDRSVWVSVPFCCCFCLVTGASTDQTTTVTTQAQTSTASDATTVLQTATTASMDQTTLQSTTSEQTATATQQTSYIVVVNHWHGNDNCCHQHRYVLISCYRDRID